MHQPFLAIEATRKVRRDSLGLQQIESEVTSGQAATSRILQRHNSCLGLVSKPNLKNVHMFTVLLLEQDRL